MKEAVKRIDPGAEFTTSEKCSILDLANTPDDPEVSIAEIFHSVLDEGLSMRRIRKSTVDFGGVRG